LAGLLYEVPGWGDRRINEFYQPGEQVAQRVQQRQMRLQIHEPADAEEDLLEVTPGVLPDKRLEQPELLVV